MCCFLTIILIVLACWFLYHKNHTETRKRTKIREKYRCQEGEFDIRGHRDDFIISKNKNIDFLVKDGMIVAGRDKRVDKNFVFYGGDKS